MGGVVVGHPVTSLISRVSSYLTDTPSKMLAYTKSWRRRTQTCSTSAHLR